ADEVPRLFRADVGHVADGETRFNPPLRNSSVGKPFTHDLRGPVTGTHFLVGDAASDCDFLPGEDVGDVVAELLDRAGVGGGPLPKLGEAGPAAAPFRRRLVPEAARADPAPVAGPEADGFFPRLGPGEDGRPHRQLRFFILDGVAENPGTLLPLED